jgi:uncharacterized ParB-like nuclease family protein
VGLISSFSVIQTFLCIYLEEGVVGRRGILRVGKAGLVLLLSLTLVACGSDASPSLPITPVVKAFWEPPYVPIKFGIDSTGAVSAEFAKELSITTFIGKFGLEGSISAPTQPGTIRLVFVDRAHGLRTVYDAAVGNVPVVVDLIVRTTLKVTSQVIEVDITDVNCVMVRKEGDTSASACSSSDGSVPPTVTVTRVRPTDVPTLPVQATVPTASNYCYGNCWDYDATDRTMTWTGPLDGKEDVWQPEGDALVAIRRGDTASFVPMSVPGEIEACMLILDGTMVKNACDGILYEVPAGVSFEIRSPGEVGGFRWMPQAGYGYR